MKVWIRKMIEIFLILLPLSVFFATGKRLEEKFLENRSSISEYDKIRTLVTGIEQKKLDGENAFLPDIQEERLLQENSDYAAWIYIPDTRINYPVVLPKDNQLYLKRTFQKEKNASGCLFFDAVTGSLFSEENAVIHGHNMKNGTMFGGLKWYLQEDYAKEHWNLYLYRNGEWKHFQLFSVYLVSLQEDFPYQTIFRTEEDFQQYKEMARTRSLIEIEQNQMLPREKLITCSTCYGERKKLIVQWVEKSKTVP